MVKTAVESEAPPSSAWLSKGEKSIRAIIYEKVEPPPTGIKEVLLKFAGERYSGHGLHRVASDDGKLSKLIWVVVYFVFFGLTCFGLYHFFAEFLQFRTIQSVEVTYNDEVTFPAVTVCNQNAIDVKKVEEYFGRTYAGADDRYLVNANKDMDLIWRLYRLDKSLAEKYQSTIQDTTTHQSSGSPSQDPTDADTCEDVLESAKCDVELEYCLAPSSPSSTATAVLLSAVEASKDSDELRAKLSFTKAQLTRFAFTYNDMVKECMFDGQPCEIAQRHVWKHSKYGTCITFNGDVTENSEAVKTTKYGEMHGLKLKLDANIDRNINIMTPSPGFRVVLHHPDEIAFPEESGYDIPAGKKSQFAINLKYIDRLGKPYGKCGGGKPDKTRGFTGGWMWGRRGDPFRMDKKYTRHFNYEEEEENAHHVTERSWAHDGEYTESGCRGFYRNAIFEDKCGCTKVLERTHVESDLPDCDVTDDDMASCIIGISTIEESRVNGMRCYPPCQESKYKPVFITSSLRPFPNPAEMSSEDVKKIVNAEHCIGEDVDLAQLEAMGYQLDYDAELKDTSELSVFLQSPRIERTSEFPKYQVQQFLFHVAGVMLLLLGSSVFLIPEILELIIDLCLAICCRRKEETKDDQYTSEEVMIEYPEINELSTNLEEICGGIFAIPEAGTKGPAPPVPDKRPKSTMSVAYDIPATSDPDERPKSTKSIAYDIPASDECQKRPTSTTSISYDISAFGEEPTVKPPGFQ